MPKQRAMGSADLGKKRFARALLAPLFVLASFAPNSTESAIANGDTRTLNLTEPHTNESGSFTYMVNGSYDSSVLEKLNWFMRDWRHDEQIKMDPKLFDVVWEVYRESGSSQPIEVLSGYRSPETNAMLRRRSRQVAEHSQHIAGRAMDAHFLDVPTSKIRDIGMRLQAGGVGFYPTGNTPWVHLDSGSVRYWPRMSRDALVRLFPDGKTVHIPSDGVPLAGYEQARAEIEARGGNVFSASAYAGHPKSLLAMLFGGGEDEGEGGAEEVASNTARGRSGMGAAVAMATTGPTGRSGPGQQSLFAGGTQVASAQPDAVSRAKRDLPRGETFMSPASGTTTVPATTPKPQVVAALEHPSLLSDTVAAPPIPTPPQRPTEFSAALSIMTAPMPTPPARPAEFAALQAPIAVNANSQPKNDVIAALLLRKLPGVITRGVGGALPSNALALADSGAPVPPERPALLAKAAALSAPVRLPPLIRAAMLSAPLPPIERGPPKPPLVAAKIDASNFGVMTAPKTPTVTPGAKPAVAISPRTDALVVALIPAAQVQETFSAAPYGDLSVGAFTGSAVRPADASAPSFDAQDLRGAN